MNSYQDEKTGISVRHFMSSFRAETHERGELLKENRWVREKWFLTIFLSARVLGS
jgi:hypothetical protein